MGACTNWKVLEAGVTWGGLVTTKGVWRKAGGRDWGVGKKCIGPHQLQRMNCGTCASRTLTRGSIWSHARVGRRVKGKTVNLTAVVGTPGRTRAGMGRFVSDPRAHSVISIDRRRMIPCAAGQRTAKTGPLRVVRCSLDSAKANEYTVGVAGGLKYQKKWELGYKLKQSALVGRTT